MKQHYGCPIKATLNVMSGKWKVLALWYLSFKPHRFAELRGLLPGVTEKVLTAQLEEAGAGHGAQAGDVRLIPGGPDEGASCARV